MKTFASSLIIGILATGSVQSSECCVYGYECNINQQDRDRIWNEMHFCIKKMNICLENADRAAARITDFNVEQATRAAISGAIGGLSTRNIYGVVISTCLNTLGSIAGDGYHHFLTARNFVKDAEYYAFRADELQERLWRN